MTATSVERPNSFSDTVLFDVAPLRAERRLIPPWLRSVLFTDSANTYDAFLSYSWACDKEFAKALQAAMHGFQRPWYTLRAKTIFRDLSCLPASSDLIGELKNRLDRSHDLIVLASPDAAHSRGMEIEARHWLSRKRSGEILIIVTSSPTAAPKWEYVRSRLLPPALRDAFAECEPLWISLIAEKEKFSNDFTSDYAQAELIEALKQIFLRLYPGRTWESLRGEERAHRRRALSLMTGTLVVFLLLFIGISWEFIEAKRANVEAAANYATAINSAESTVAIVTGFLAPDGVRESRSGLAERLLAVPAKTYNNISAKYEPDETALERVKLLDALWQTYFILNNFEQSADIANAEFRLAQSHEKAGVVSFARAAWLTSMIRAKEHLGDTRRTSAKTDTDLRASEMDFREALNHAQKLKAEPDTVDRSEVPVAYQRVGDILRDRFRLQEALAFYKVFLRQSNLIKGAKQRTATYLRQLAIGHGKLADIYVFSGRLDLAESELQTNLALSKLALAAPKNTPDMERGLAVAHERIAFVRRKQGRLREAYKNYLEELAVIENLIHLDHANVQWAMDEALANEGLGDVLSDEHKFDEAEIYYRRYRNDVLRFAGRTFASLNNTRIRRDVAIAYQRLGTVARQRSNKRDAARFFKQCSEYMQGATPAFDPRNSEPRNVGETCQKEVARL